MEKEQPTKRNEMILKGFSILLNALCSCIVIHRSTWNGFSGVLQQISENGVLAEIVAFLFLWWLFGALYGSINMGLVMFLYMALHFKDATRHGRNYHPSHEEEWHSSGWFALKLTAAVTGLFVFFLTLGVMNID